MGARYETARIEGDTINTTYYARTEAYDYSPLAGPRIPPDGNKTEKM